MRTALVEFSRLARLIRLGSEPLRRRLVATQAERAALAARFGLVSLARFEADVELVREAGGTILLTAAFEADFEQSCIVTLDSVEGRVSERFCLRYGPAEAEADMPGGDDDPAFEPLTGDAIDIGEAVAQEFSLSLPPFPRAPGATVAGEPPAKAAEGPFAALRHLARRERE